MGRGTAINVPTWMTSISAAGGGGPSSDPLLRGDDANGGSIWHCPAKGAQDG
jgi:hypothetical protein